MADLILVVADGRIAEAGNDAALIAQQGLYAELQALQAAAYRYAAAQLSAAGSGRPTGIHALADLQQSREGEPVPVDDQHVPPASGAMDRLRADCESCFGLCCVVPAFAASTDFAISKPAGKACPNLGADFGCRIHPRLRDEGFRGCTAYDCFGAGQRVSQVTFGGRDWRSEPRTTGAMFAAFPVMRDLHELLWFLAEALEVRAAASLVPQLRAAAAAVEELAAGGASDLLAVDIGTHRRQIGELLRRTSELYRGPGVEQSRYAGADLIGAKLKGARLGAADLRGAQLIAADLRNADLRHADLLGADLRDADLRGADLRGCLFLLRSQLVSARGDRSTRLGPSSARPEHW